THPAAGRLAIDVPSYIIGPTGYQAISGRRKTDVLKSSPVGVLAINGIVAGSAPAPPSGSHFRANARLTGVTSDAPASTLTLRWTYEAGGAIESSAAIVDGVVYVGSSTGEALAIGLERET